MSDNDNDGENYGEIARNLSAALCLLTSLSRRLVALTVRAYAADKDS